MAEERKSDAREGIKEGLKAGLGILSALKEALEETFEEVMKERDFGPDRARDAFKETVKRAQDAMDGAKDRLDFVPRKDFDALRAQVDALRQQMELHLSAAVHHSHGPVDPAPGVHAHGDAADASAPGAPQGDDRSRSIPADELE